MKRHSHADDRWPGRVRPVHQRSGLVVRGCAADPGGYRGRRSADGLDGVSVSTLLGDEQELDERMLYWEAYAEGGFQQAVRQELEGDPAGVGQPGGVRRCQDTAKSAAWRVPLIVKRLRPI
jgi:hypothetical protein